MRGRVKIHQILEREIGNAVVNTCDTGWGWSPVTLGKVLGLIAKTQKTQVPSHQ